jgi:hypothetical protein
MAERGASYETPRKVEEDRLIGVCRFHPDRSETEAARAERLPGVWGFSGSGGAGASGYCRR